MSDFRIEATIFRVKNLDKDSTFTQICYNNNLCYFWIESLNNSRNNFRKEVVKNLVVTIMDKLKRRGSVLRKRYSIATGKLNE